MSAERGELVGMRGLYFRKVDLERNQRRWYMVHVQPTLFGEFEVVCSWGRLGHADMQSMRKAHATIEEARRHVERLAVRRGRRGYERRR